MHLVFIFFLPYDKASKYYNAFFSVKLIKTLVFYIVTNNYRSLHLTILIRNLVKANFLKLVKFVSYILVLLF